MMFLRQEDFATVVRSTPLVSLDFIVENSRGEFLLGKRTNRPAQGYWFVPGGRVQKDETLEAAFERLTMAELGLRLPITAGQFYGVWQHFYDDNFSGTDFTTHYVVLGFRFRVSEEERKIIDDKVAASKMTRTEFIIRALEKQPVTVIPNAPELLTELKRQGNNLNQAVRNYYFDKGTLEEILSCVDKLKEVYKAILFAVGGE